MAFRSRIEMIHMNKQYGLIISVFIHAIILAIPVSMAVKDKIQDIELFVLIEEARNHPAPVITKKKEIMKPIKRVVIEEKPQAEIVKPVEVPMPQENNHEILEPAVVDESPAEKPIQEKTINPQPQRKVIAPSQINSSKIADNTIETEFGRPVAPAFLHREMPKYPLLARKLGKEGKVVFRLTIDERGNLLDIEVVKKAGYGFTEAAVNAIKKSTFLPAKKDGKPVSSRAILPVRFTLRRD